jgi:predicted dehydrogenase
MNVGIVGCGVISRNYAEHAPAFGSFEIVACADVIPESAAKLAEAHRIEAVSIDELFAAPGIQVVLNLTPSGEHAAVTRAALEAGKHVYTEKPLAIDVPEGRELLALADSRGLRIGCAPDIFLGSAYQAARAAIDEGLIGEPLAVSAAMLVGGPDSWHPNPQQFFSDGAGPLLDMGPYYLTAIVALLGPIRRVAGFTSMRKEERQIMVGPNAGERFLVTTPTHASAAMELDGGVTANLVTSFEAHERYVCDFEVHGMDAVLRLPDPNAFGGTLQIRSKNDWEEIPYVSRGAQETRGVGLHDMVEAIAEGRDHRASGRLGLHVIDAARSILRAADERRTVEVETGVEQPGPRGATVDVVAD